MDDCAAVDIRDGKGIGSAASLCCRSVRFGHSQSTPSIFRLPVALLILDDVVQLCRPLRLTSGSWPHVGSWI